MTAKHRLARLLGQADPGRPAVATTSVRVRTPPDVLALLEEQINAVRADRRLGPAAKARVIGRLAAQVVKTIEVTQLAARLEVLEAVLKQRKVRDDR